MVICRNTVREFEPDRLHPVFVCAMENIVDSRMSKKVKTFFFL